MANIQNSTSFTAADHPFIVRAATGADAVSLSVLAMQVYLDTYARRGIRPSIARDVLDTFTCEKFDGWLAEARSEIRVAECDDHLVGFAHVTFDGTCALAPGARQAELLRLYVQEPFTANGIGTALLLVAERLARSREVDVLWLTPWVGNARALGFYRKHGYADVGQTWYHIEGEAIENRVYAKWVCAEAARAPWPAP